MSIGLYLPQRQSVWTFTENGLLGWQAWQKPRGATLITMIGVGGGGGAGGGHTAAAGVARGGGGGGGCGAITKLVIPAMFVPDSLYILPGMGGVGGTATNGGTVGTGTFIASQPVANPAAVAKVCYLFADRGAAGNPGTSNGAGGGAGPATTGDTMLYSGWGVVTFLPGGSAGTAGGASTGAAGTVLVYGSAGKPVTSGTGGGGVGTNNTNFAGGDIMDAASAVLIPGGVVAGGAGNHGIEYQVPPFFSGGTGGGTNGASGVGGVGGEGSWGCGGGGGGGGVTGGAGGRGGSGVVWIIVSF